MSAAEIAHRHFAAAVAEAESAGQGTDSLCRTLLGVGEARPFRGPAQFEQGDFRYINACEGDISEFHGAEYIDHGATRVYSLRYSGGILR